MEDGVDQWEIRRSRHGAPMLRGVARVVPAVGPCIPNDATESRKAISCNKDLFSFSGERSLSNRYDHCRRRGRRGEADSLATCATALIRASERAFADANDTRIFHERPPLPPLLSFLEIFRAAQLAEDCRLLRDSKDNNVNRIRRSGALPRGRFARDPCFLGTFASAVISTSGGRIP